MAYQRRRVQVDRPDTRHSLTGDFESARDVFGSKACATLEDRLQRSGVMVIGVQLHDMGITIATPVALLRVHRCPWATLASACPKELDPMGKDLLWIHSTP